MGGILKNKENTAAETASQSQSTKEFREQVLKNTKLNAKLKGLKPEIYKENGEVDLEKLDKLTAEDQEKLQWNQKNLSDNAEIQERIIANMETSIDEPKTPFQHAAELNEYYQSDGEEDELNGFSLGEPEFNVDELDNADVETPPVHPEQDDEELEDQEPEEEEQEQEQPKKKKMTFDELRKMHYHHEVPKFHPEDEDDDDEE